MAKLLKLIEDKFYFWAIAFLLFFIPLYPKFPLLSVSETYVSVRLEDFVVTFIVAIFALWIIAKKDYSIFKWTLTKILLLYFAVGILSLVSAVFITRNIIPHLAFLHFLRRVEYISLLFISYYSVKNLKQLKTFAWTVWLSTLGVIIYGLGQKFMGWPVVSTMNREFSKGMILKLTWWARVNSTFAGHYDLAAFMVMVFPLIVVAFIIVKKKWIKLPILFLGILCYYILILTASRVSFGAYLISVLLVLIMSKKKWFIAPFLVLSILGMVFSEDLGQRYAATFKINLSFLSGVVKTKPSEIALGPTPAVIPTATPVPVSGTVPVQPGGQISTPTLTPTPTLEIATLSGELFEPTEIAVGRSTDIRLKVEWPRAITAFLKNPLLGTGYSSITLATDNDYLRLLGETGILGFLAFGAVLLEIFRRFYFFLASKSVSREARLVAVGILGSSAGYFLNATFIDVLEASKVAFFFWIMIGVGLKVVDINEQKN